MLRMLKNAPNAPSTPRKSRSCTTHIPSDPKESDLIRHNLDKIFSLIGTLEKYISLMSVIDQIKMIHAEPKILNI